MGIGVSLLLYRDKISLYYSYMHILLSNSNQTVTQPTRIPGVYLFIMQLFIN